MNSIGSKGVLNPVAKLLNDPRFFEEFRILWEIHFAEILQKFLNNYLSLPQKEQVNFPELIQNLLAYHIGNNGNYLIEELVSENFDKNRFPLLSSAKDILGLDTLDVNLRQQLRLVKNPESFLDQLVLFSQRKDYSKSTGLILSYGERVSELVAE